MEFKEFKAAVAARFAQMCKHGILFTTDKNTDDGLERWELYLKSFPPGTDQVFRNPERTEHDCSACRSFIKRAGGVVAIDPDTYELISIWDCTIGEPYKTVATALSTSVKQKPITDVFLSTELRIGVDKNVEKLFTNSVESGQLTWHHFAFTVPQFAISPKKDIGEKLNGLRGCHDVLTRSVNEITNVAIETTIELIETPIHPLYRGHQWLIPIKKFQTIRSIALGLSDKTRDNFIWHQLKDNIAIMKIGGRSIGTLLYDLSDGTDSDIAVKKYESKVSAGTYQRPAPIKSEAIVNRAKEQLKTSGLLYSLARRHATIDDLPRDQMLFINTNRSIEILSTDIFEQILRELPNSKVPKSIETVNIGQFIRDIVPKIDTMSVMFENVHVPNLMSIITTEDPTVKCITSWGNHFTWTYGMLNTTDAVRERVKQAGGLITGDWLNRLSWSNFDDLDLRVTEPDRNVIYYGSKHSNRTGGKLDVDMNADRGSLTKTPVENIVYPTVKHILAGEYLVQVHNFCKRENENCGFEVDIEIAGVVHKFGYENAVRDREFIDVAVVKHHQSSGISIAKSFLTSSQASKTVWNLKTQKFHNVIAIFNSPNHWYGKSHGLKHTFFILENGLNEGEARGIYNEFLPAELHEHRKAMEMVGSKVKAAPALEQLSGIGFSEGSPHFVVVKVSGQLTRTIKITF